MRTPRTAQGERKCAEMATIGKRITDRAAATFGDAAIKMRLAEHHSTHGDGYEDGHARLILESAISGAAGMLPGVAPVEPLAGKSDTADMAELRTLLLHLGASWCNRLLTRNGVRRLRDLSAARTVAEIQNANLAIAAAKIHPYHV